MKSASYTTVLFFSSQNPSSVTFDLFFSRIKRKKKKDKVVLVAHQQ